MSGRRATLFTVIDISSYLCLHNYLKQRQTLVLVTFIVNNYSPVLLLENSFIVVCLYIVTVANCCCNYMWLGF